jgi:hypothetical protein
VIRKRFALAKDEFIKVNGLLTAGDWCSAKRFVTKA